MNKEEEIILINHYFEEETMQIFNSNGKGVFLGNYWDFDTNPNELKKFLEKLGLRVEINELKSEDEIIQDVNKEEMINKILKRNYSQQEWDSFIDDPYTSEIDECSIKFIYKISEEYYPEYPELYGFWETQWFEVEDCFEFPPYKDVQILNRTQLVEKTIIKKVWEICE